MAVRKSPSLIARKSDFHWWEKERVTRVSQIIFQQRKKVVLNRVALVC